MLDSMCLTNGLSEPEILSEIFLSLWTDQKNHPDIVLPQFQKHNVVLIIFLIEFY